MFWFYGALCLCRSVSLQVTLQYRRTITEISSLKFAHSSCQIPVFQAFLASPRIVKPISFLLVVTEAGGLKLSLKTSAEDQEEIQEATASISADINETSSGNSSMRTEWRREERRAAL